MPNFRNTLSWKLAKRLALDPVRRAAVKIAYPERLPLQWCRGSNWGDALSPVLAERLSGKVPLHVEALHHYRYMAIGSILEGANRYAEVWGSGFIRESGALNEPPAAVHAVRGPLSRNILLRQGIHCPEIYGDPALLFPRFFNPAVSKRYSVGIIPHYIDKRCEWLERYSADPSVLIIDIECGIEEFVRAVKSCDVVVSSSLHGLICADAYGVPNVWVKFSDNVIGGDFKFRDYRLSIGADEKEAIRIKSNTALDHLVGRAEGSSLAIDLQRLLLACPFLSEDLRQDAMSSPVSAEVARDSICEPIS